MTKFIWFLHLYFCFSFQSRFFHIHWFCQIWFYNRADSLIFTNIEAWNHA